MKKNIVKISSALAVMLLSAALLMGISCFAYEADLPEKNNYAQTAVSEQQETVETQTADVPSSGNEEKSVGKSLAIGISAGLIISIVVCVCIKVSYKTHGQTEPYKYDENAQLTLIDSSDILINTHVEKRRIEKD